MQETKTVEQFKKLSHILEELREKCPWDKEQTFESLRPLTIEETYELSDGISSGDFDEIKKELGDLLLHVMFYSKMGEEQGRFTLLDVIEGINNKLIYRHPHVFADTEVASSDDVMKNWEQLKLKEKGGNKRVLAGVPSGLPSIIKAKRIQEKSQGVGFDWEERAQVWNKVQEEIEEFQIEVEGMNTDKAEQEMGDIIFALINASRLYNIDPDTALERTNRKFIKRFEYLEDKTIAKGRLLKDMSLAEMEEIWQEAKSLDN
ncbi:MAG: nucleoside triphosphate pyrophosphohydrolase [Bacteroidales bacterium]